MNFFQEAILAYFLHTEQIYFLCRGINKQNTQIKIRVAANMGKWETFSGSFPLKGFDLRLFTEFSCQLAVL
jgi:hypothetical protein